MRGLLPVGLVVAGALVALGAQQQPPPPPAGAQQPPVFRGGTNQVRVDVTVLNRKGEPLTDLTKDDFEVREDGELQAIDNLKLVEANGAAPADDTSLPIRSPYHAAAEAARDDIRVFVIFWDEYHIGEMAPAIRARAALQSLVQTAFGPTDLVALMDQLTPTDAIRFTRNRRELADQAHKLKGRFGVYVPPRSAVEEAQMYRARDIEMLRAQVTATALDATIQFLGSIKEGRKSILLVSQTIGRVGPSPTDTTNWLSSTIRVANANNTAIYVLDPRGLDMNMRPSDILHSLADETGGRQISNNEPAMSLRTMVTNASAFYLLGYASAKNPADGKFHKIAVKVKRPNVEVRARTGYFAPSLTDMDAARKKAEENTAPPEVAKALEKLVDAPHMAVSGDLWAGAAPGAEGRPRVMIVWSARAGPERAVSVRASGADGRVFFDAPLEAGRAVFDAAPGKLVIRRSLLEADGSISDKQDVELDVPDFAAAPLAISTPVLFRARTPREVRVLQGETDPPPFAGRAFERTDRILVRFGVFGTAAADATVTVTLLSRQGAKLAVMPVRATPGGLYEIDLPVGSIARGDFVFEIAASKNADQVKTLLSFRVN
jgi:VWFA-related protein